jgi:hypothetical protein
MKNIKALILSSVLLSACATNATTGGILVATGSSMCAVPLGQVIVNDIAYEDSLNDNQKQQIYSQAGIMCIAGFLVATSGMVMMASDYENKRAQEPKVHKINCTETDKSGCANSYGVH